MKRKHLKKIFRICLLVCFVTFFALYISQSSGYVEYENRKKVALTEKQIKKFEKDIADGKQVDLEKYIQTTKKDYQNSISKVGLKISRFSEKGIKKAVETSFKFLGKISE